MLATTSNIPTDIPTGWHAELSLHFAREGERTILARRQHFGPLVVQRPFYPEGDVCHVYLVHPPGGVVGGDQLRLEATLEPGSHVVITTPAATKFYRTLPGCRSHLHQELQVENATLEWLPQETILFDGAHASTSTIVRLQGQSRFIGWEQICYGRPASDALFENGRAAQRLELWLDSQPILLDRLQIGAATMNSRWGLAGNTMLSTVLAYPANVEDLEVAREQDGFSCTLVDRVLSCRLLTGDGDLARHAMIALWQALRPRILDREAVLPRIWAT